MKIKTFISKDKSIIGTFIIDKDGNSNLAYNWHTSDTVKDEHLHKNRKTIESITSQVRKYCEYKGYFLGRY